MAFVDVFPQLVHPINFSLCSLEDLLGSSSLALRELKHLFVVDIVVQSLLELCYLLIGLGNLGKTALNTCLVEVEWLFLESCIEILQLLLEFLDARFCLLSLVGFSIGDLPVDTSTHLNQSLQIIIEFLTLFELCFLLGSFLLLECLDDLLDSIQCKSIVFFLFIDVLQAIHDFQQLFDVFIQIFITDLDSVSRCLHELAEFIQV